MVKLHLSLRKDHTASSCTSGKNNTAICRSTKVAVNL